MSNVGCGQLVDIKEKMERILNPKVIVSIFWAIFSNSGLFNMQLHVGVFLHAIFLAPTCQISEREYEIAGHAED